MAWRAQTHKSKENKDQNKNDGDDDNLPGGTPPWQTAKGPPLESKLHCRSASCCPPLQIRRHRWASVWASRRASVGCPRSATPASEMGRRGCTLRRCRAGSPVPGRGCMRRAGRNPQLSWLSKDCTSEIVSTTSFFSFIMWGFLLQGLRDFV
jgi:hypothetical protein